MCKKTNFTHYKQPVNLYIENVEIQYEISHDNHVIQQKVKKLW